VVVEKKKIPSPKEDSVTDLGHAGTKLFPGENSATDLGYDSESTFTDLGRAKRSVAYKSDARHIFSWPFRYLKGEALVRWRGSAGGRGVLRLAYFLGPPVPCEHAEADLLGYLLTVGIKKQIRLN